MGSHSTSPRRNPNTCNQESETLQGLVSKEEVHQILSELVPSFFLFDEIYCLTTAQVAEITGSTKETVQDWIKAGKLLASKPGKEYIITVQDFKRFLKSTKVKAPVIQLQHKGLKRRVV